MKNCVVFHDDSVHEMARWAARRYRLRFDIVFRKGWRGLGYEHGSGSACHRRGRSIIELNACRTYSTLVQVLAHELGHLIAMRRYHCHNHGRKFIKVMNKLIDAWNSHVDGLQGRV